MTKFYDVKSELKTVTAQVEFFKIVRRAIKDAQQSASDYHLGVNEDVIINKMCKQYSIPREEYDTISSYFNQYILDLIKR